MDLLFLLFIGLGRTRLDSKYLSALFGKGMTPLFEISDMFRVKLLFVIEEVLVELFISDFKGSLELPLAKLVVRTRRGSAGLACRVLH